MKNSYFYWLFGVLFLIITMNQIFLTNFQRDVESAPLQPASQTQNSPTEEELRYKPAYVGELGSAHNHIDLLILIKGDLVDLSLEKYQLQSYAIHLESDDKDVVHLHAFGIDLKFILETLKISLTTACIKVDSTDFCNSEQDTLKVYVNEKRIGNFTDYLLKDLDRVLISFGNENDTELQNQLDLVTSRSRIFSRR